MAKKTNSDWQPLGGTSRNFLNTKTGQILSRRQYDKQFGTLAKQGFKSYQQKAKANKSPEQVLKPARGRAAFKGSESDKAQEINRRQEEIAARNEAKKGIKKYRAKLEKKFRHYEEITDRSFGKSSAHKIELPLEYSAIEGARKAGARNPHIFGYLVYLNFLNPEDGSEGSFCVIRARDIKMPFTKKDFEKLIEESENKSISSGVNFLVYSCSMQFILKVQYVRAKREKEKERQRKKIFGKRG